MQDQDHSYLDLSVLPEISRYILSSAPVVLVKHDLTAILWANAAGARLFGGKGVVQLLASSLHESQAFTRQLNSATSQMGTLSSITRGFLLSRDDVSALIQFEIQKINLDQNTHAYLVVNLTDNAEEETPEYSLAKNAVQALEGFADASAILDDQGLVIAASSNFADIGPSEITLQDLSNEIKGENDKLIKRPLQSNSGESIIAGFANFQTNPARNLVVLASATPIADDAFETENKDLPLLDETDHETINIKPDDEENLPISDAPAETQQILTESLTSFENMEPDVTSDTNDEETYSEQQDVSNDDENLRRRVEDTIRFAWTTDENSIFTFVSEELANIVGQNASDIIGRKWSDVATVLGFDNNREISTLLSTNDTWSGKTVLWPIQATDLCVPIDLAALPVFDANREFQGFRGFGIIRNEDTMVDPDATGLALASPEETNGADEAPQMEKTELFEEPEIKLQAPTSEENHGLKSPSNIVRLVPKTAPSTPNTLSEKENRALEDIRRRLKGSEAKTEQQPALENRRPSQGHLDTSLMENLPIAILVYRTDETLFANRELLETTGYSTIEELAAAGGIDSVLNPLNEEDNSDPGMQYVIRKDGSRYSIKPVLQTVPWDGDKALMLSFAPKNDISFEHIPALEISTSSEIQSILDTASDGIILTDASGVISSINASAQVLFGCSDEDVEGQFIWELFAEESKEIIQEYMNAISSPGVENLLNDGRELIGIEAQGGTLPLFLTITEMQATSKLCFMLRDMTEWKKAEEELINARRNAEESNEQKSEFLAHVSHEIRTPLNAIIGFSDVMLEERFGPIRNDRYREYLRDINRSGAHVLELVNDLLDLSKIEAGKLELAFEAVDLNLIVAESVALLQPQANTNRIIIRTSLSRAVPKVVADTRSMRQIVLNLVSNAIKFSSQNSQVIVSTIYETNGEVALRVRDTGKGMTESELVEAMKPFQQIHSAGENMQTGTGLGLPLTKALVEANRAYFTLESEPESGTIANVNFPNQRVLAD